MKFIFGGFGYLVVTFHLKKNRMDLKLTIILKDSEWGFSDLLDGRDLNYKTTQEIKDLIKEDYHSVMQNYIKIDKV